MRKNVVLNLLLLTLLTFGCTQPQIPKPRYSSPRKNNLAELKIQVDKLITRMSSSDYNTREKATKHLRKLLKNTGKHQQNLLAYLQKHLDLTKDPEISERLETLLEYLDMINNGLQLEVIWVESDSIEESNDPDNGRILMKINGVASPFVQNEFGELLPDPKELLKHLKDSVWNFEPTKYWKSLPVIVKVGALVPPNYVDEVIELCKQQNVSNIILAKPEKR